MKRKTILIPTIFFIGLQYDNFSPHPCCINILATILAYVFGSY